MNTTTNSISATGIVGNYLSVLKNFSNFKGRARRSEYWYFVLAHFMVAFTIGFLGGLLSPTVASLLSTIYTLATLIPLVALCIRRVHDVDKSGWFALVPIYNFILAITEGTYGPNQYGPDPKAQSLMQVTKPVA